MLERTDAITNEVLEPITFVLACPTVCVCEYVCVYKYIYIYIYIYISMQINHHIAPLCLHSTQYVAILAEAGTGNTVQVYIFHGRHNNNKIHNCKC